MATNLIDNVTTMYESLKDAVDQARELYENAQTQVKSTEEARLQSYKELIRLNEINNAAVEAHEKATQIESKQKERYEAAKAKLEEVHDKLTKLIGAPAQVNASGKAPEVALSQPEVAQKDALSQPEVAPEDALSQPEVAQKDALSQPEVAQEDALSQPEVAQKDALSQPEVAQKDALSQPEVAQKDALSQPEVTPEDALSQPEVTPPPARPKPDKRGREESNTSKKEKVAKEPATKKYQRLRQVSDSE